MNFLVRKATFDYLLCRFAGRSTHKTLLPTEYRRPIVLKTQRQNHCTLNILRLRARESEREGVGEAGSEEQGSSETFCRGGEKEHHVVGSQASPACPSGRSSMKMKM
jgi:hypothetical protein